MDKKHQVHNLIVLDESGSMDSIKDSIMQGFNEIVQTIKSLEKAYEDQEHFISLVSFNGVAIKTLHFMEPVAKLEQIDYTNYLPNASTPLYDALGNAITSLKNALHSQTNYNVLVTILTDGYENASVEYKGETIKKMIDNLKDNNWTFTYIGAEHDVEKVAFSLSIENTIHFCKSRKSMDAMFAQDRDARANYSRKIANKGDLKTSFYENLGE